MNKKGQSMGLGILSFLAVLIIGLMFVNFLMPEVTTFRTEMSCSSADTISDGTKLLCLFGDATIPYVIVLIFSLAIVAITSQVKL